MHFLALCRELLALADGKQLAGRRPPRSSGLQGASLEATVLCRLSVLFCVLESKVHARLCLAFSVHFGFESWLCCCMWSELPYVSSERIHPSVDMVEGSLLGLL